MLILNIFFAGMGGMAGLYKGLRATTLAGQTGKVRRTQLINYVMKQGLCIFLILSFTWCFENISLELRIPCYLQGELSV